MTICKDLKKDITHYGYDIIAEKRLNKGELKERFYIIVAKENSAIYCKETSKSYWRKAFENIKESY